MMQERLTLTNFPILTMGKNYYRRQGIRTRYQLQEIQAGREYFGRDRKIEYRCRYFRFQGFFRLLFVLNKFDDQSSEEISVNVTGKMIVQKNISKIPLKLPYICGTIKEQVKNIYDTKEILVGSVNYISTDNQNISAQSLLTAYEKMPLTDE